eukprot:TRINITY_DN11413_c0_g1_i1.p2 TRINITY_DN11413_c0_g1~~TRINITY_DN11413_c0_g1_i1.p2  ORF type:complete len:198 (+),score=44.84 TRINITY_DN11413_c0_g1_i1:46-594(+)
MPADFDPRRPVSDTERLRPIKWAEVRQHTTEADAWFVVHGRVYDVSGYGDQHPGGADVLMDMVGEDATEDWEAVGNGYGHGRMRLQNAVNDSMRRMLIGRVEGVAPKRRRPRRVWAPTDHHVPAVRAAALVVTLLAIVGLVIYGVREAARMAGVDDSVLFAAGTVVGLVAGHVAALYLLPQG